MRAPVHVLRLDQFRRGAVGLSDSAAPRSPRLLHNRVAFDKRDFLLIPQRSVSARRAVGETARTAHIFRTVGEKREPVSDETSSISDDD